LTVVALFDSIKSNGREFIMQSLHQRLAGFLALNRSVGIVLLSVLFFGLGEQLWSPFMPMLLDVRAKDVATGVDAGSTLSWEVLGLVGLYACLRNLLEGFCYIGGGQLTARLGDRGSLIFFGVFTIAGYALFLGVSGPIAAVVAAMLILGWEPLSVPLTFTTVGATIDPSRRGMAFAIQSIQKRLPKIIGPALAGFVIDFLARQRGSREAGLAEGMYWLVGLAFVLGLASLAIQVRWMPHHPLPPKGLPLREVMAAIPLMLRRLLFAEVFKRWCDWLVREFVVLYLVLARGVSIRDVGLLMALQNVVALITYLPIGRMTRTVGLQPFIGLTFIFFALFPLSLVLVPDSWLALAFVVNGLREIGEPARKALITTHMPEAVRARAIGMYWGTRSFAICWAPLAGAALWYFRGPEVLFYVAFALGAIGATAFYLLVRVPASESAPPASEPAPSTAG
jgi:MFS family permease